MGLILNRSPNLWLGAFVAVFSVVALVFHLTPEFIAAIDAAAGAVIVLVAGNDGVQIASGEAAKGRQS